MRKSGTPCFADETNETIAWERHILVLEHRAKHGHRPSWALPPRPPTKRRKAPP
jgi:hypothetical protein